MGATGQLTVSVDSPSPKQSLKQLFLDIVDGAEVLGPLHPQTSIYKKALKQKIEEL